MGFWKANMPAGMFLRSGIEASNIAAPQVRLSLIGYQKATGKKLKEPLPIEDFIAYGQWFQKQVAPNLDKRSVRTISRSERGFCLTFEDGDSIRCSSLVLALGIGQFAQRPKEFAGIPRELAPHSSDLSDLSGFKGKRVAVIGRGQSALEYAALLHEHDAEVQIITRSPNVDYLRPRWRSRLFRQLTPGPLRPLSYAIRPPTDLGDYRTARTIASPEKFRRQTPEVQEELLKSVQKPRGSHWLRSRLKDVAVRANGEIESVKVQGDGLTIIFSDGSEHRAHRVVLATGYRVDIAKCRLLDESIIQELQTEDGYPVLTPSLETSVPDLYMAGVIAERTLGPTLRFVTGTSNAGPGLGAALARKPIREFQTPPQREYHGVVQS